MGESPLPSPRLPPVNEWSSPVDNPGNTSVADSSRMDSPVQSLATVYSASNPNSTSNLDVNSQKVGNSRYDSPRRGRDHSDGEFLDMEEGESEDVEDEDDSARPRGRRNTDPERDLDSATNPYGGLASAQATNSAPNLRAEDFPMPPSTTATSPTDQTTFQQTATPHSPQTPSHRQIVTVAADYLADGPRTPTANTYVQGTHTNMSGTTLNSTAKGTLNGGSDGSPFRALPLLPHDLPRTRIQVISSSVRPNERGKDVLSFVVYVDPNGASTSTGTGSIKGKGKEAWSIEKMYSDVLGLDQRVRARVGKSVGKKIANLPDGKLWRDHAPSKVDQRKVSAPTSSWMSLLAFVNSLTSPELAPTFVGC